VDCSGLKGAHDHAWRKTERPFRAFCLVGHPLRPTGFPASAKNKIANLSFPQKVELFSPDLNRMVRTSTRKKMKKQGRGESSTNQVSDILDSSFDRRDTAVFSMREGRTGHLRALALAVSFVFSLASTGASFVNRTSSYAGHLILVTESKIEPDSKIHTHPHPSVAQRF